MKKVKEILSVMQFFVVLFLISYLLHILPLVAWWFLPAAFMLMMLLLLSTYLFVTAIVIFF